MTPDEMRQEAMEIAESADLLAKPTDGSIDLARHTVWAAAAEICERLDRLIEQKS